MNVSNLPNFLPTIVLMGLRGSGKSTLGVALAEALGRPFVDLDERTPALLGERTPADAINQHGLAAFRKAEHDALQCVLGEASRHALVLALGGGTPTAPGADATLAEARKSKQIVVVYLHAGPAELRDRLSKTDTASRPSLTGTDMLDEIETIYLQRDALFRNLASVTVETAGQTDLLEHVLAKIESL